MPLALLYCSLVTKLLPSHGRTAARHTVCNTRGMKHHYSRVCECVCNLKIVGKLKPVPAGNARVIQVNILWAHFLPPPPLQQCQPTLKRHSARKYMYTANAWQRLTRELTHLWWVHPCWRTSVYPGGMFHLLHHRCVTAAKGSCQSCVSTFLFAIHYAPSQ